MYGFMDEREAARFLGLLSTDLKRLRERGGGPRYITLPTGAIRYQPDDLEAWATSTERTVRVADQSNILPFPGITVQLIRKRLPRKRGRRSRW